MVKLYLVLISLLQVYAVVSYSVLYAHIGDNVSLPCIYASTARYLCWYKQAVGKQPELLFSNYIHSDPGKFEGNKQFSVFNEAGSYHLQISNIQQTESAIYYCGRITVATTEFDNGTFLILKESMHISLQQQNVSKSVQPGDSVTLNCTVHTGTSTTEHTVYWFREDLRSSNLGILYVYTNNSGHCVKSLESGSFTQRCMYSLTKRNVRLSDAGVYYCAVVSCGEILFGNKTELDLEKDTFSVLMKCIVAALLWLVIMNVVLIGVICRMMRGKHHCSRVRPHQTSVQDYNTDPQNEECDALQYVALDFKKRQNKNRRHRNTEETTLYSSLKVSEL